MPPPVVRATAPCISHDSLSLCSVLSAKISALSPLHAHAIKPKTLDAYRVSVLDFINWANSYYPAMSSMEDIDDVLANYAFYLCDDNPRRGQRQKILYVIAGIEFFMPRFHQRLRHSRLSVKDWDELIPGMS